MHAWSPDIWAGKSPCFLPTTLPSIFPKELPEGRSQLLEEDGGAEERQEPGSQATWVLGQVRLLSRLCVLICQMGTQQPAQTPLCDGWENPVSRKYQGFVNYEELNSVMGVQPLRSHASCLP